MSTDIGDYTNVTFHVFSVYVSKLFAQNCAGLVLFFYKAYYLNAYMLNIIANFIFFFNY